MLEVVFLLVLGGVWILFASIQDIRTKEVSNWLSFSLVIFAIGFRFFYSLFQESNAGFGFFYQGLIGLVFFFILGELFYYGRVFGGGDEKLMWALGPILFFSDSFFTNLKIMALFLVLFLFTGAIYGVFWMLLLGFKNFRAVKKRCFFEFSKRKKLFYGIMFLGLIFMVLKVYLDVFFILGIILFIYPYLISYARAVEESFMVKRVSVKKLVEGDLLYKSVKVKGKIISADGMGLSSHDIKLIRKRYGSIKIKEGIPYVPVFLISFLALAYFWFSGLLGLIF